MTEHAIEATGIEKRFGAVRALDGVDLRAPAGSVLGLLGPNGAGKTTMVRILATLLKPDAGSARVAGLDVVRDAARLRSRIGLAGQYAAVDENLTGFENLDMVGRLSPVLFLDEPTTGLDPRSRLAMWDLVQELVGEGTTVLLTTQYLDEADRLADRIAVIDQGRVIAEGTSDELKDRVGGEWLEVTLTHPAAAFAAMTALEDMTDEPPQA